MVKIIIVALITFLSCNTIGGDDFSVIPLEEYDYVKADIDSADVIDVIAFSGGPAEEPKKIFYYQFIGVRKATGDTIRILSPLMSVPTQDGDQTYMTPLEYNSEKGVTTATYHPLDNTHNLVLQHDRLEQVIKDNKPFDPNVFTTIKDPQLVVMSKDQELFQRRYPTAIGILSFDKIPY